jgi:hypothetical protein
MSREAGCAITRVHVPVFRAEDYAPQALAVRWLFYTQGPEGFKRGALLSMAMRAPTTQAAKRARERERVGSR